MRVLVAMSGGVDSSVVAALLCEKGFDVSGVTMKLTERAKSDVTDALAVAQKLQIPHQVLDLRKQFKKEVVDGFIAGYLAGETPNPCVDCNRTIKFGVLLELALRQGFDFLATGHYVEKTFEAGRYLLQKAADCRKDQSYVLYSLTQNQLSRVLFPLGKFSKEVVREKARALGLPNFQKEESQDICFIDGYYADFIKDKVEEDVAPGKFIDSQGRELGYHRGLVNYTVGQRKGLGISFGEPMYVVSKHKDSNRVVLGKEEELFRSSLLATDLNFIPFDWPELPAHVEAKVRYSQNSAPAEISAAGDKKIFVQFQEPQRAIASGQSVVFYRGDLILGGGKIV